MDDSDIQRTIEQFRQAAVNAMVAAFYRPFYDGLLIANNGFGPFSAAKAIANNEADMVAFGRYFISNPDLVGRIKNNQELQAWDDRYFYSGGTIGYLD